MPSIAIPPSALPVRPSWTASTIVPSKPPGVHASAPSSVANPPQVHSMPFGRNIGRTSALQADRSSRTASADTRQVRSVVR